MSDKLQDQSDNVVKAAHGSSKILNPPDSISATSKLNAAAAEFRPDPGFQQDPGQDSHFDETQDQNASLDGDKTQIDEYYDPDEAALYNFDFAHAAAFGGYIAPTFVTTNVDAGQMNSSIMPAPVQASNMPAPIQAQQQISAEDSFDEGDFAPAEECPLRGHFARCRFCGDLRAFLPPIPRPTPQEQKAEAQAALKRKRNAAPFADVVAMDLAEGCSQVQAMAREFLQKTSLGKWKQ